jgi:hypothetical protein
MDEAIKEFTDGVEADEQEPSDEAHTLFRSLFKRSNGSHCIYVDSPGCAEAAYLNRLRKKSPTLRIPLRRVSTTGFTGCSGQVSFGAVPVR